MADYFIKYASVGGGCPSAGLELIIRPVARQRGLGAERKKVMEEINQRISYLEESCEALRVQNLVLGSALKSLLRSLPPDMAQDVLEAVRAGFDDELARLEYSDSAQNELFHDATYAFFGEKNY